MRYDGKAHGETGNKVSNSSAESVLRKPRQHRDSFVQQLLGARPLGLVGDPSCGPGVTSVGLALVAEAAVGFAHFSERDVDVGCPCKNKADGIVSTAQLCGTTADSSCNYHDNDSVIIRLATLNIA